MLFAFSAFLVVCAFVYGLGVLFIRGAQNRETEVLAGGRPRPLIFGPSTAALAGMIPTTAGLKTALVKELQQAGHYHRRAFEEFASLRNVLTMGWVLLIATAIVATTEPGDRAMVHLLLAGLVGTALLYGLPRLVLRTKASARIQRIQYALPDALDMITMCMTGGLPIQQSIHRVGADLDGTHPDLACELRILSRQMETGCLDSALRQFAQRIDTAEVQSLVAMVGQTDRQGSSVAGVFQEFADGVRTGRRQRAEEHGNKATVKLLFPLVFCLAPPIYMLLLAPAMIELRSFVLQENRPGGMLDPAAMTATENDLTGQQANLLAAERQRQAARSQ